MPGWFAHRRVSRKVVLWRGVVAFCAVAVVIAPAGGATASRTSATAAPTALTARVATTVTTGVPWRLVGRGWFTVLVDNSTDQKEGSRVLYVVDPVGKRYEVRRWAPGGAVPSSIGDWSADHRYVLLIRWSLDQGESLAEVDLATRGERVITTWTTGHIEDASYTRPTGANLLVVRDSAAAATSTRYVVERRSRYGVLLTTLVTSLTWPPPRALYADDGTSVVIGRTGGSPIQRVVTNRGVLVRRLDTKPGACEPVRWWDSTTVLARCVATASTYYYQLWLVPLSGADARRLTATSQSDVVDFGFFDAWHTPYGYFLQWRGDCGTAMLERLMSNGKSTPVTVPGALGHTEGLIAVGSRIAVRSSGECGEPGGWLGWYDTRDHTSQKIMTSPVGIRGIDGEFAFGSR